MDERMNGCMDGCMLWFWLIDCMTELIDENCGFQKTLSTFPFYSGLSRPSPAVRWISKERTKGGKREEMTCDYILDTERLWNVDAFF